MRLLLQTLVTIGIILGSGTVRADAYDRFFQALGLDDAATVGSLLQRGFPVDARDARGQPALVLAIRAPAPKVLALLMEHPQVDLNQPTPAGETALMIAALEGQLDWTRRLADRGAALDSPSGWTALHYAATGQNPDTVALLLTRGAVVDARAPNGATPLMMAARHGDQRHVDLLLTRGADPRAVDRAGRSAADYARMVERDRLAARLQALQQAPPR